MIKQINRTYVGGNCECCQQRQRGQGGRADSEPFTSCSRSVAQGVQSVGALSNLGVELRLFSNATSVVSNGAIGVCGQRDPQSGQKTDARQGYTVEARQLKRNDDGESYRKQRDDRADHTCGNPTNHNCSGAGL